MIIQVLGDYQRGTSVFAQKIEVDAIGLGRNGLPVWCSHFIEVAT